MRYVENFFRLSDYTQDYLKALEPPFSSDGFGEFIFYRTYSRNMYGYQETWADCVIRVINGVFSIRKDWYIRNHISWNEKYWQDFAQGMAISMFEMEWLPPGRGLWAMGTDFIYERGGMALYNCFSGNTKFIVNGNIGRLADYENQEITVVTAEGQEAKATVKRFGIQPLQQVTFSPLLGRSKLTLSYNVTPNHRWILSDGSVTENIKVGDAVQMYSNSIQETNKKSQEYIDGFTHGIVFGDGTHQTAWPERFSIRLCKDRYLLDLLTKSQWYRTHCNPPSYDGDPNITFVSYACNLKKVPINPSLNYLAGFFDGWTTADGSRDEHGAILLSTINSKAAEWLIDRARLIGWIPVGWHKDDRETNFGKRSATLNKIRFSQRDVAFKVKSIEDLEHEEEVYCVIEPKTQSFTLAGGIPTGNCAYTNITDNLGDDLAWAMDSLMLGVGVGFGPIRNDNLKFKNPKGSYEFVIPDSREGWVESVRLKIDAHRFGHPMPKYVYDEIRLAGEPINGFGGLASGPDPLKYLHDQIDELINRYTEDHYYDSVRLKADLANQIGCCVVAGNVRRSAEILLGKMSDPTFRHLKNYSIYPEREDWGWMSNNSVMLSTDEDFEALSEIAESIKINGEPGFINLRNFPKGRVGRNDKLRKDPAVGMNPCQPAWAKVITPDGIREFKEVEIGSLIWSETGWTKIVNKWSTGIKKVYKYQTTAGVFYGTEDHQIVSDGLKIPVQHALTIDALIGPSHEDEVRINAQDVIDGFVLGDGTKHGQTPLVCIGEDDQDVLNRYTTFIHEEYSKENTHKVTTTITIEELPLTYYRRVPDRFLKGTQSKVMGFLRGLYSANGSVCGNRVTLKAASRGLIEDVQMMLSSLGIKSYFTTNKSKVVEFSNGDYECRESYDLNISESKLRFAAYIGFIQDYKTKNLEEILSIRGQYKNTFDIISVEYLGEEEVFDITVSNSLHTYWTQCCNVSNCGEIPLEHREVCNVDETLPTMCRDSQRWAEVCPYATMYTTTVSLLPTHQPSTNKVVARNRRIGVGIIDFTGWVQRDGLTQVTKYLRRGYKIVRKRAAFYNAEAGVPEPIRVTTVKPGGTVPKLPGKTSGASYPNFHTMIRRVRVAKNSPTHPVLSDAGVPFEADVVSVGTDIFEFPYKNNCASPAEEVSVWQQAANVILLQNNWADNAVSNTINYRPKWKLQKVYALIYGHDPLKKAKEWLANNLTDINRYYQFIEKFNYTNKDFYDDKLRVKVKYDDTENIAEIKLFIFDPQHEEDMLESVLAYIAPHVKSVILLPHSAKGAYPQMPEEGITETEYQQRLMRIKPINWNIFNGSDGIDERYCQGEACELPVKG